MLCYSNQTNANVEYFRKQNGAVYYSTDFEKEDNVKPVTTVTLKPARVLYRT